MIYMDIKGTTNSSFQIQKGGPKFVNASGTMTVKNAANTLYADIIADIVRAAGDSMVLNEDATEALADWKYNIKRPVVGMTADVDFTLPVDFGASGNMLLTDGSGNLYWGSVSVPTNSVLVDTTDLNWDSPPTVSMFTLPANAIVDEVKIILDTAFDSNPDVTIGTMAVPNKFMDSGDVDLTSGNGDAWVAHKNLPAVGVASGIEAAYIAGGLASVGAARILTKYYIPS